MNLASLVRKFERLRETDPRNAAEYAYAIATLYKRQGNVSEATSYASQAIELFDKCPMNTLEDCSARNVTIGGIAIPDLIHQGVVGSRFLAV
jgi:hypothetical protein